jgi:lactate racemase
MRADIQKGIKKVSMEGWKKVKVEYGREYIEILVPRDCAEITMENVPFVADPKGEIDRVISNPIQSPTIEEIVGNKNKPAEQVTVAITVSDITRPVPYKGEGGILPPILRRLESAGVLKQNIKIIVGNGTHRPSTKEEKVEMYGESVVEAYQILDHNCEILESLTYIGKRARGQGSM